MSDVSEPRIAVVGVGAVGSVVAGLLAAGGRDVTVIDQWPANVDAIKADGLRVGGTNGDHTVRIPALHIHEVQGLKGTFDVVLLAVKSYDTDWSTILIEPYLAPDGVCVTLQNGINDHRVAAIVGTERALGCVTLLGVAMQGPGHGMRTDTDAVGFKVGEHDGSDSERVRAIADLLTTVNTAVVTRNLWGDRWSKLALNCMVNPLAALSGFGAAEVRLDVRCERIGLQLGAEAIEVGRAAGHDVEPVFGIPPDRVVEAGRGIGVEQAMASIADGAEVRGNGWPSMLQDVRRRRRTEVDHLNGHVVDEGRRLGVATPLNQAIVDRFREVGTDFDPRPDRIDYLFELVEGRVVA